MYCENCGNFMPEDSRFCESCGSAVSQQTPPEGFTYDQNSGLYYIYTDASNPETGETGSWTTWFYPQTGEYKQVFTPDPVQPAVTKSIKPKTPKAKVKLSPLNFIIPVAGLIIGVLIALIVHYGDLGGKGQRSPDNNGSLSNQGNTPAAAGTPTPDIPAPPVSGTGGGGGGGGKLQDGLFRFIPAEGDDYLWLTIETFTVSRISVEGDDIIVRNKPYRLDGSNSFTVGDEYFEVVIISSTEFTVNGILFRQDD